MADRRLACRRRNNLKRLLNPRQIAFVGGKHLQRCIAMCRDSGYQGEILAINPKYESLGGVRCVPSVDALEGAPDAAFVALSRERTSEVVSALAKVGTGGIICHAAGYGELGGEHRQRQQALAEAAQESALIGPNCMGVLNAFDGACMWGEYNLVEPVAGSGVALVSQSGALLFGIITAEQAYPMGYGISVGNQAVIDSADLIDVLLDDKRVRVIGLYVEGLNDGPKLADALLRALQERVPVVLLRGGGTPESAERSLSHTGNLAVPNDYWAALTERYSLIEVFSPKQLVETTKLLAVTGSEIGKRVFFVSSSGAAGTLLAEQALEHGLTLPEVPAENTEEAPAKLSDVVTISNPFDFNLPWQSADGVSLQNAEFMTTCLRELSAGITDALTFFLDIPRQVTGGDTPWLPTLEAVIALRKCVDFPIVMSGLYPEGIEPHVRRQLLASGVAPLCGFTETLNALGAAVAYTTRLREAGPLPPPLVFCPPTPGVVGALDEWHGKKLLAEFGLRVPTGWAGPASEAGAASSRMAFPVAVKILSKTLLHKSSVNGVRLEVDSIDEVETAVRSIQDSVRQTAPEHILEHFLVEQMVPNVSAELLVGIKRHSALGLALVIGTGGVNVETISQYSLALLPATDREIDAALEKVLSAAQSNARANVLAAIRAVERFAVANVHRLVELDVNPLIVTHDGTVFAADALIVFAQPPDPAEPT